MGNTTSSNVTNALINAMVNITTKNIQTSTTTTGCQNKIVLKHCNLTDTDIQQNCNIVISQSFIDNAQVQAQVNAQITQEISQIAQAISQNISFNPGSTNASNVANAIVKVGENISNTFAQNFAANLQSSNLTKCIDSQLNGVVVDQDAMTSYMVDAMMKTYADDLASLQVEQSISQSATAEQQNALFSLMIIIVAIVVMVVGTGGKVITQLTSPQFIVTIAPLAIGIGYLILAYTTGLPPFTCVPLSPA